MSDPKKPVTPEQMIAALNRTAAMTDAAIAFIRRTTASSWLKMPEEPLEVVNIITIHDGCVCEAWQDDDEWFAVGPKGVEVITPRIYQPMPPMPTDEEIVAALDTPPPEGEKP